MATPRYSSWLNWQIGRLGRLWKSLPHVTTRTTNRYAVSRRAWAEVLAAPAMVRAEQRGYGAPAVPTMTVCAAVQLDHGDGYDFSFELACADRAGSFLRNTTPRLFYHFTMLGLAYSFDLAQARDWLFTHPDKVQLISEPGPTHERRVIARIPFDTFLREIDCHLIATRRAL